MTIFLKNCSQKTTKLRPSVGKTFRWVSNYWKNRWKPPKKHFSIESFSGHVECSVDNSAKKIFRFVQNLPPGVPKRQQKEKFFKEVFLVSVSTTLPKVFMPKAWKLSAWSHKNMKNFMNLKNKSSNNSTGHEKCNFSNTPDISAAKFRKIMDQRSKMMKTYRTNFNRCLKDSCSKLEYDKKLVVFRKIVLPAKVLSDPKIRSFDITAEVFSTNFSIFFPERWKMVTVV